MAKILRFALRMRDIEIRSLEELCDNYEPVAVLNYFHDGRLVKWLTQRNYGELAEAVLSISTDNNQSITSELAKLFGVQDASKIEAVFDAHLLASERHTRIYDALLAAKSRTQPKHVIRHEKIPVIKSKNDNRVVHLLKDYNYNAYGDLVEVCIREESSDEQWSIKYEYDAYGRKICERHPSKTINYEFYGQYVIRIALEEAGKSHYFLLKYDDQGRYVGCAQDMHPSRSVGCVHNTANSDEYPDEGDDDDDDDDKELLSQFLSGLEMLDCDLVYLGTMYYKDDGTYTRKSEVASPERYIPLGMYDITDAMQVVYDDISCEESYSAQGRILTSTYKHESSRLEMKYAYLHDLIRTGCELELCNYRKRFLKDDIWEKSGDASFGLCDADDKSGDQRYRWKSSEYSLNQSDRLPFTYFNDGTGLLVIEGDKDNGDSIITVEITGDEKNNPIFHKTARRYAADGELLEETVIRTIGIEYQFRREYEAIMVEPRLPVSPDDLHKLDTPIAMSQEEFDSLTKSRKRKVYLIGDHFTLNLTEWTDGCIIALCPTRLAITGGAVIPERLKLINVTLTSETPRILLNRSSQPLVYEGCLHPINSAAKPDIRKHFNARPAYYAASFINADEQWVGIWDIDQCTSLLYDELNGIIVCGRVIHGTRNEVEDYMKYMNDKEYAGFSEWLLPGEEWLKQFHSSLKSMYVTTSQNGDKLINCKAHGRDWSKIYGTGSTRIPLLESGLLSGFVGQDRHSVETGNGTVPFWMWLPGNTMDMNAYGWLEETTSNDDYAYGLAICRVS